MRYYLGQLEYKWSHVDTQMEQLWVMRELGNELYKTVEENKWCWVLMRSNSMTLPSDIYCRTLVYADSDNDKLDTHFILKYPNVKVIELT
jgi:hypothetical protein